MEKENDTPHDVKSESKGRPKYMHSQKEKGLVETLLGVDEENEIEDFVNVITWDIFESISGWEDASPNVKYTLPKRRRPAVNQTQDGQPLSYNQGKSNWSGSSQCQSRSYELDFVDSPAWKICVEPNTYRYIPNNGRYRASKLVKKLEIQKCVRKTCIEKLSPEQRQLQKEIQRELRREFEIYLRLEKQKNNIHKLQKHREMQEIEETEDELPSESHFNKEITELHETTENSHCSHPGSAVSVTSNTVNVSCSPSTPCKHSNSRKPAASSPASNRSTPQAAKDHNSEQKQLINSHNLELPPIHVPLVKPDNDQHRKRYTAGIGHENNKPISSSMMFQKAKFMLEGHLVEPDHEQERAGLSDKNKRSVSEPPPQCPIPASDLAARFEHNKHIPELEVPHSQPQTHRQKFDYQEHSIGYTQSLCDVRQPIPSIPTRIETLTKDMMQIKPITHGSDKLLGQNVNSDGGIEDYSQWHTSSRSGGEVSANNYTDIPHSDSTYSGNASTKHSAPAVNSAPLFPTRKESKSAHDSSNSHLNKGLLENGISASRFTSSKVNKHKNTFLSTEKKRDYRKAGSKKAARPPFEPQVENMAPSAISVAQAFHSVPINKAQPRTKKTQEPTPQGLLPEISGQRIPVSLTSQRII